MPNPETGSWWALHLPAALSLLLCAASHAQLPVFDARRAFEDLETQCEFGPRNPGSRGHEECRQWLASELDRLGLEVWQQSFEADDPATGAKVQLTNIIARVPLLAAGETKDNEPASLLLCAHWDTRPRADRDPDTANYNSPIIGANDGASGVAVLLELARLMAATPPPITVLIAFWDGEDMGRPNREEEFCLGSKYWAAHPLPQLAQEAILLDMVGDAELEIPREYYSALNAPTLLKNLWALAWELDLDVFTDLAGPPVIDDHLPLQEIDIPAVNIVDFDYEWWHTMADTPDKCAPQSLEQVGILLVEYIYIE